ncbi:KamA family radical SAM protein [Vitreimonas sp.]|uniref:KamA family radical SAM protein n=1 Tax=Vitreimonas sp. TaxID=3069702 RepID=UPI002EDA9947
MTRSSFVISPEARAFNRAFFKATNAEWNDWRWQLRNRIRSLRELDHIFVLNDDERAAVRRLGDGLPLGITPYFASRMNLSAPEDALRRTHIPVGAEWRRTPGEAEDPLGEDADTVVPGLVHRYPDRVLFLATGFCSTYCRYCTRSRMVGSVGAGYSFTTTKWEAALSYIEQHREVRDVLISGGDPLTLSDDKLEYLLDRLNGIDHVEFIRIGTKVPVVLPTRVTPAFVRMLRRLRRVWMSVHFTHPGEFSPEVDQALGRLADAGVPLGSQTVLLKDVNDDAVIMRQLMHGLLQRRVRPYYLYQCDPIAGSAHFRTPVSKGLEIIEALRGHTSGYAVPHFVIDAPGGGGKLPLLPQYATGRDNRELQLRNYRGDRFTYPDPQPSGEESDPHLDGGVFATLAEYTRNTSESDTEEAQHDHA